MSKRTHFIYIVLISLVLTGWFFDRQVLESELTITAATAPLAQVNGNKGVRAEVAVPTLGSEPAIRVTTVNEPNAVNKQDKILGSESTPDVAALLQEQVADYTTQYYEQGYDTDWSYAATQKITDLFAVHAKELESFNVLAIECKSSICQIKTDIDGNHFMQIMQLQKLLIEQAWYGSNSNTTFTTNDDGLPYEIYISLDR